MGSEGDGAVTFVDVEGDVGTEEALAEEEGGEPGTGDEDWFARGGGHGGNRGGAEEVVERNLGVNSRRGSENGSCK